MKFPAQFVLQVAENESRVWWGMREANCCLRDVNVRIVAQQCYAGMTHTRGWNIVIIRNKKNIIISNNNDNSRCFAGNYYLLLFNENDIKQQEIIHILNR